MLSACCKFYVEQICGTFSYYRCLKCGRPCYKLINTDNEIKDNEMPAFSQESFSKLSQCHIDLQTLFYEVIKYRDCKILEGHRGQLEQNAAFAEGKSKLRWPDGKHNASPSLAVDVAPYPIPAWSKINNFIYFGGFVMGIAAKLKAEGKITHDIRYGGDFNGNEDVTDQSFVDAVHFEIHV